MKTGRILTTFFLLIILLCNSKVFAQGPVFGGELSWKQVSSDSIYVEEHVWATCGNGIPTGADGMSVVAASGSMSSVSLTKISERNFTPLCKSTSLSCKNLSGSAIPKYLITEYTLATKVRVPSCSFSLMTKFWGSSSSLTAIASQSYFCLIVQGDICHQGVNASPSFSISPSFISYKGFCNSFPAGATIRSTDSLGNEDSTVCSITPPLSSWNSSFSYNTSYTYTAPVLVRNIGTGECSGFNINSKTGQLTFRPSQTDMSLVAIKSESYRKVGSNRILIGSTMRCTELDVIADSSYPTFFDPGSILYTYPGIVNSWNFSGASNDTRDSMSVELQDSLPKGAIFKVATHLSSGRVNTAIGAISWTADSSDIKNSPYHFTTIVSNNRCTTPATQRKEHLLYVIPRPDKFNMNTFDKRVQCVDNNMFYFEVQSNDLARLCTYIWNFGDDTLRYNSGHTSTVKHSYNKSGTFTIVMKAVLAGDTLAIDSAVVTVEDHLSPGINNSSTAFVCNNYNVNFRPVYKAGPTGISYQWKFGDGTYASDSAPAHTFLKEGTYTVTLVMNNSTCDDSITKRITIRQVRASASVSYGRHCNDVFFSSNVDTTLLNKKIKTTWDFGDGTQVTNKLSTGHTYAQEGTYTARFTLTSDTCGILSSVPVTITFVHLDFSVDRPLVCKGTNQQFKVKTGVKASDSIQWNFGDGTIYKGTTANHAYSDTGTFLVRLSAANNPCLASDSMLVKVVQLPDNYTITGDTAPFRYDTVTYKTNVPAGYSPHWTVYNANVISDDNADSIRVVIDNGGDTVKLVCDYSNGVCTNSISYRVHPVDRHSAIKNIDGPDNGFTVFPNPATGNVTLRFNNSQDGIYSLQLIDATDRVLSERTEHFAEGNINSTISLSSLPAGVYYLKLAGNNGTSVKKIIKQ